MWPNWQVFTGVVSEMTGRGMQRRGREDIRGVRRLPHKLDSERKCKRHKGEKRSTEGLTAQAKQKKLSILQQLDKLGFFSC